MTKTSTPEPQSGFQGESRDSGHQGRQDAGRAGPAVRCPSEPVTQWRSQILEGATAVSGERAKAEASPATDVKVLHAKIGELTLAN